MKKTLLIIVGGIVLCWLAWTSWFTVDRTEYVYRTRFGKPVGTYDGATSDAGLHFKWPWPIDTVQRLDHRLQHFDVPEMEVQTRDPLADTTGNTMVVKAYVVWRIAGADGVDRFIRTVGNPQMARDILEQRIKSRLGAVISNLPIDELISVVPAEESARRMDRIRDRLLGNANEADALRTLAESDYGIELVDVRLKSHNHPASARDSIFNRIRSERGKKVADHLSMADQLARNIESDAKLKKEKLLAEARAEAERRRRQADTQADMIRNQAHAQDRDFYTFLQKLEAYQKMLGETKDLLLLSARHELFDLLLKPPQAPGTVPMPKIEDSAPKQTGGAP